MVKREAPRQVSNGWNFLAKEQKIAAGVFAVCGIIVLSLSVRQVYTNIANPFTVAKSQFEESQRAIDTLNPGARELAESMRRDTDGDGLSDYAEEKVYGTSPYLRDTDGDRTPDNVELAYGENPNCASGNDCPPPTIDLSLVSVTSTDLLNSTLLQGNPNDLYAAFQKGINQQKDTIQLTTGSTSTLLEPTLVREASAIRKVLAESGKVDAEFLDGLSDAQLLQLYDEALVVSAQQDLEAEGQTISADDIPAGF
jgi:hypothetical protein